MSDGFPYADANAPGKVARLEAEALLDWAVSRWNAEVANRPLRNVNRRPLDDTWRQVVRRLGADDVVLLGPRHDDLVADG